MKQVHQIGVRVMTGENPALTCLPSRQKREGPQGGMLAALLTSQSLRTWYQVWFFAATSFQRPKNPVRVRQFFRSETLFLTRPTSRVFFPGDGRVVESRLGGQGCSLMGATYVRERETRSPLDGHNAVCPLSAVQIAHSDHTQKRGLVTFLQMGGLGDEGGKGESV